MSWGEATSGAPLGPGAIVGPYEISGHLATGGMGEVYIARKKGIGGFERMVVLKVMLSHLAHDERFARMFIDEARICSQLSHPNIVQVFDLGESETGSMYLAMEHLSGQSVAACVKSMAQKKAHLPLEIVARIAADAAVGLAYAHQATDTAGEPLGLVHRDISPENLYVTYAGPTKILDFGVAKVRDRLAKTQHGEFKGKVGYMAPEIIKGQPVDPRCDLFSLGIVLFEMLTTRRLFHAPVPATSLHRVLAAPIPDVRKLRPDVDDEFARIVHRMLERDPKARTQNAEAVVEQLEAWLAGKDITNKVVGQWLKETFKDAHEAIARVTAQVAKTGRIEAAEIAEARRLGGEELADTLVRELSDEERSVAKATSDLASEAAFAETAAALVDHDDGWIRRARFFRWALALLVIGGLGFAGTKLVEKSIADVRDAPRIGQAYADHYDVTAVHGESRAGVLASATDRRDEGLRLLRTTPRIRDRRGVVLAAINRANVGLEKLEDPRLPPAKEIGIQQERVYTVYAVEGGRTLLELMEKEAVSPERARTLALEIVRAFAVAHVANVVHGSFTPSSVWVTQKKTMPNIVGFQGGVATLEQVGASAHVAPEHRPDVEQAPAADQYAVASVLSELFKALDQQGAVLAAGVLTRATAVDAVQRYRDMGEMAKALEDAFAGAPKKKRR